MEGQVRGLPPGDVAILRELARRVAAMAHEPIMAERREMWIRHNMLDPVRPMVLVFPEGSWRELLPQSVLRCEGAEARRIEWDLRSRIYYHEHLPDDSVIEGEWLVRKAISVSGWGLEPEHEPSAQETGAWGFRPVIHDESDLEKLTFPRVHHDEQETACRLAQAHALFDGILPVRLVGVQHVSFHLMSIYCQLRGLEQVMWDMYDQPDMLHRAMRILEEGHHRLVDQYVALGLLELNNDGTYHSSGGVGYTRELPAPGYRPGEVRTGDMWSSAEAQEMAEVSPPMHREFILAYEKRLLARFGLNGYGCCENLCDKLEDVFTIPRMRRISISPFAPVAPCAEKLGADYIYSWKPHPAHLVGDFDEEAIRRYLEDALQATRGCVVEMILKDTHTCEHRPERFTRWTEIAQEVAAQYA
jgi:hypothetical protein